MPIPISSSSTSAEPDSADDVSYITLRKFPELIGEILFLFSLPFRPLEGGAEARGRVEILKSSAYRVTV